ncbi:MAG TPA: non-homologous end-joining DNA ligase, partial [Thermoanaerobaculia bacterium]
MLSSPGAMVLETYREKRRFDRTPEPAGETAGTGSGRSFVVQKHAATREHYDFRLEWGGVLKSWAVPKGPSLDPADKRLAVETEDHPVEYGGFEGVIPEGEYGGGTVLLWDRGSWSPDGDPEKGYRKGKLSFELAGAKLRGRFALVRLRGDEDERRDNWLLIKEEDAAARPGEGGRLLEERPESVESGRTMEEVAAGRDRVWRADGGEVDPSALRGARERALRGKLSPQLPTLVERAPAGEGWLHEIKFDGYRLLAFVQGGKARLVTRKGQDWTAKFRPLADALVAAVPAGEAVLDGEAVALQPDGTTSFAALQQALSEKRPERLHLYLFDLLHLEGWDLRESPLAERKALLRRLLPSAAEGVVRYSDHVEGQGEAFHRQACRYRLEGVVSKRADAGYRPGRNRDWVKTKCQERQELVIGGFSEPSGSRQGLGSLLLGFFEEGRLVYAGRCGTGFTTEVLADLRARLDRLERKTPPFADPPTGADARGVHWVTPKLVCEVEFTEWTEDGRLRHPSFQGLREDKDPAEVRRERPREPPRPARRPGGTAEVAGVPLTSPDRVLYEGMGLTKLDL